MELLDKKMCLGKYFLDMEGGNFAPLCPTCNKIKIPNSFLYVENCSNVVNDELNFK